MITIAPFPKVGVRIEIDETISLYAASAFESNVSLDWLFAYANKSLHHPQLDLSFLSPFQQTVLKALQQVPLGKTVSYGELARIIGNPKSARAIGNACNRNPYPLLIPCHRVIQGNGRMGGFAIDLEVKRRLLEFEGKSFLPSMS